MSIQRKPQDPYWVEFATYQSFETVEAMIAQVKLFERTYILTPAIKAVLNTIKLHAKRYFAGVCWLKREEIAKKAKVSLASVKRAIKELKEVGILTVYPHIHTKRGGQAHNIYVINPLLEPEFEPASVQAEEAATPTVPTVRDDQPEPYTNLHTNPHTNLKEKDISIKGIPTPIVASNKSLSNIPREFIKLMEPFYANNPEIIRARWKTVCVAVKNNCVKFAYTSWESIGAAWKDTVRAMKRGKLKNATDDGLGGYFYGVLSDYLMDDFWRNAAGS